MSQIGSQVGSQLTREDMLRELELLPIWQLRQPLPTQPAVEKPIDAVIEPPALEQVPPVAEQTVPALPAIEAMATEPLMPELTASPEIEQAGNLETPPVIEVSRQLPLRLLLSDDGAYAFLIEPYAGERDNQAVETLFKNMIRAMRISCRADVTAMADKLFAENAPRLIISMGEAAANSLLHKTYGLDEWRSNQLQKQIFYGTIPVVVTYHPEYLLEHSADKAHAWHDLCLAMKLMQSL